MRADMAEGNPAEPVVRRLINNSRSRYPQCQSSGQQLLITKLANNFRIRPERSRRTCAVKTATWLPSKRGKLSSGAHHEIRLKAKTIVLAAEPPRYRRRPPAGAVHSSLPNGNRYCFIRSTLLTVSRDNRFVNRPAKKYRSSAAHHRHW